MAGRHTEPRSTRPRAGSSRQGTPHSRSTHTTTTPEGSPTPGLLAAETGCQRAAHSTVAGPRPASPPCDTRQETTSGSNATRAALVKLERLGVAAAELRSQRGASKYAMHCARLAFLALLDHLGDDAAAAIEDAGDRLEASTSHDTARDRGTRRVQPTGHATQQEQAHDLRRAVHEVVAIFSGGLPFGSAFHQASSRAGSRHAPHRRLVALQTRLQDTTGFTSHDTARERAARSEVRNMRPATISRPDDPSVQMRRSRHLRTLGPRCGEMAGRHAEPRSTRPRAGSGRHGTPHSRSWNALEVQEAGSCRQALDVQKAAGETVRNTLAVRADLEGLGVAATTASFPTKSKKPGPVARPLDLHVGADPLDALADQKHLPGKVQRNTARAAESEVRNVRPATIARRDDPCAQRRRQPRPGNAEAPVRGKWPAGSRNLAQHSHWWQRNETTICFGRKRGDGGKWL
jgi:hypothetical protein